MCNKIILLYVIIAIGQLMSCFSGDKANDPQKNARLCDFLVTQIKNKRRIYEDAKENGANIADCRRHFDDYVSHQAKLLKLVTDSVIAGTVFSKKTLQELLKIRKDCMSTPDTFDFLSVRAFEIALLSPCSYEKIEAGIDMVKDGFLEEPPLFLQSIYSLTLELDEAYVTPIKLILFILKVDAIFRAVKPLPKGYTRIKDIMPKILSKHNTKLIGDFSVKSGKISPYESAIGKYEYIKKSALAWIDTILSVPNQNFPQILSNKITDKGLRWIPFIRSATPDSINQESTVRLIQILACAGDKVTDNIIFNLFNSRKFCEDYGDRPSLREAVFQAILSNEHLQEIKLKNRIKDLDDFRIYYLSHEPTPQVVIQIRMPQELPDWTEEEALWAMCGKVEYGNEVRQDNLAPSSRKGSTASVASRMGPAASTAKIGHLTSRRVNRGSEDDTPKSANSTDSLIPTKRNGLFRGNSDDSMASSANSKLEGKDRTPDSVKAVKCADGPDSPPLPPPPELPPPTPRSQKKLPDIPRAELRRVTERATEESEEQNYEELSSPQAGTEPASEPAAQSEEDLTPNRLSQTEGKL